MRQIRLLTVGKPRDARMAGLVQEYLKRLAGGFSVSWDTVAEEPFKKGGEGQAVVREQSRLLAHIDGPDFVVALDMLGVAIDSPGLAQKLSEWQIAPSPMVFVVGGSLGLGDAVKRRAQWQWSLSSLTLPHGLAQVVVAEQLYRAWTILQGHPYHK